MSNKIFKECGPHNVKKVGPHQYEMSISMPPDEDGRVARECSNDSCSPGLILLDVKNVDDSTISQLIQLQVRKKFPVLLVDDPFFLTNRV